LRGFLKFSSYGSNSTILILVRLTLLIGCILGSSHSSKLEKVQAYALLPSPGEIRILTINVWSGLTYKGFFKIGRHPDDLEKRYDLLISEILKLSPDVIAIQEANPLPHYAKRLAKDLDYQVIYSVALGGIRFGSLGIPTNMREGQAILVKKTWTITELGRKCLGGGGIVTNWLSIHFREVTQALLGRGVIHGKPLYLYNVHLHSGPYFGTALNSALDQLAKEMSHEKLIDARKGVEKDVRRRRKEIARLMKFIEDTLPPGMPAIIVGDFNTTAESGELNPFLYDGKWIDSFRIKNPNDEGATWDPPRNPNFREKVAPSTPYDFLRIYHERNSYRIDFILVSGNIPIDHILESRVVLTPVGGYSPSDHYGVLTTLKW
jgi:endonuclease/exonuclease/phosphatase family metal-dependent hydrolase